MNSVISKASRASRAKASLIAALIALSLVQPFAVKKSEAAVGLTVTAVASVSRLNDRYDGGFAIAGIFMVALCAVWVDAFHGFSGLMGIVLAADSNQTVNDLADHLNIDALDAQELVSRIQAKVADGQYVQTSDQQIAVSFTADEVQDALTAGGYSQEKIAQVAQVLK